MSYYGVYEMSGGERKEFLEVTRQKSEPFDKRHLQEAFCQDDVSVLRQACCVFRREFLHIGYIEVYLKSLTNASARNKLLRHKFLMPDTISLFPTRSYTFNTNYSRKAIMWLLHMENTDVVVIKHARNGREYRLPELPHFSVDGYFAETNTIYEYFVCH